MIESGENPMSTGINPSACLEDVMNPNLNETSEVDTMEKSALKEPNAILDKNMRPNIEMTTTDNRIEHPDMSMTHEDTWDHEMKHSLQVNSENKGIEEH